MAQRKDKLIQLSIAELQTINRTTNYRELDESKVQSLMESIREVGVIEPISLAEAPEGTFELIGGYHRTEAVLRLAAIYPHINLLVSAIVLGSDADLAAKRVISNSARRESVLDRARGAQVLKESGRTTKQIADAYGVDRVTIENYLRLAALYSAAPEAVSQAADKRKDALLYRVAAKFARDSSIDIQAEIEKALAPRKKKEKVSIGKAWEELLLGEGLEKKMVSGLLAKAKKAQLV